MPFVVLKISISIAIILLTSLRALDLVIMAFSTLNFYRYFYDIVKGLVHPNESPSRGNFHFGVN